MASDAGQQPEPTRFDFHRIVGRSASSVVWEATQISTGRRVALKVLNIDLADEEALRRFDRERHVMGMLSGHPHIVTIYDAGIHDQHPWLAMQFCSEGSLAARLKRTGPFPVAEAVDVLVKIGGALAVAHQRGVLHCDVKPANIMINDFGEPALGDFGISRLTVSSATRTVSTGYSLDHAPPELLNDERPTVAADIYSLGTTIWELVSGYPPFRQSSDTATASVIRRILLEPLPEPTAPSVPPELTSLLARMAAKEITERPASMDEVLEAARDLQQRLGSQPGPPPAPAPAPVSVLTSTPPAVTARESGDHPHRPVPHDDFAETRIRKEGGQVPQAPPLVPTNVGQPSPAEAGEQEEDGKDGTHTHITDSSPTRIRPRRPSRQESGFGYAVGQLFHGNRRGLLIGASAGLVALLLGFVAILLLGEGAPEVEGLYEISATEYECVNLNLQLCADPDRPTRSFTDSWQITDCTADRCSIHSVSGRWEDGLELVREEDTWVASGTLSEEFSFTCDFPVGKVSTDVTMNLTVTDQLVGTYQEKISESAECAFASSRSYNISGQRAPGQPPAWG